MPDRSSGEKVTKKACTNCRQQKDPHAASQQEQQQQQQQQQQQERVPHPQPYLQQPIAQGLPDDSDGYNGWDMSTANLPQPKSSRVRRGDGTQGGSSPTISRRRSEHGETPPRIPANASTAVSPSTRNLSRSDSTLSQNNQFLSRTPAARDLGGLQLSGQVVEDLFAM
ncbi:MAG: hypothetical protein LQ351_004579 [Letrouitia transgressa]|nr:MAG: hypothetical protein LQ351_004579 [Letrouitia transgressa]